MICVIYSVHYISYLDASILYTRTISRCLSEGPNKNNEARRCLHVTWETCVSPGLERDMIRKKTSRLLLLAPPRRVAAEQGSGGDLHLASRAGERIMTTSRRLSDRKVARFEKNVTKRGSVPETVKKGNDYPVGPIVLGFFVFVVVGSSLFQIIRTAQNAGYF